MHRYDPGLKAKLVGLGSICTWSYNQKGLIKKKSYKQKKFYT